MRVRRVGFPCGLNPLSARGHQSGMVQTLKIENMHCGACVRRVTMALKKIPGTAVEEVQIGAARVKTEAAPEVVVAALAKAGYPAQVE